MCLTLPLFSMFKYYYCLISQGYNKLFYVSYLVSFSFFLMFCLCIWVWWLIDLLCLFRFFIYNLILWNSHDYLSMEEGSLFCFVVYEIHSTRMLHIMFLVSLENSQWGGVHGLGSMTFGLMMQKFLNIKWFFHWKLN